MNNTIEEIYILLCEDSEDYNDKINYLINNSSEMENLDKNELYEIIKKYIVTKFCVYSTIPKRGHLYILFNEMFLYYGKNVYKLGECADIEIRKKGYVTGYFAKPEIKFLSNKLRNSKLAENMLFIYLDEFRMNKNREFFNCEMDLIIDKIKCIEELFCCKNDEELLGEYKLLNSNYNNKLINKLNSLSRFNDLNVSNNRFLFNILNITNKNEFDLFSFKKCLKKIANNISINENDTFSILNYCANTFKNNNKIENKETIGKLIVDFKQKEIINQKNKVDLFDKFIEERIEITNNKKDFVSSSELYQSFVDFNNNDSKGVTTIKFKNIMISKGFSFKRIKVGSVFTNLKFKVSDNLKNYIDNLK